MRVTLVNRSESTLTNSRTQHDLTLRKRVPFQQIGQFQNCPFVLAFFSAQLMEEQDDKNDQRDQQYHDEEYENVENSGFVVH